jgi:predicted Ser/Thr protein kinase
MALEVVNPLLKRRGLPHIEVETFLSDLQASSGLFLDRGNGKWGFAHLAFQEYLTVAHWSSERKISPPLEILVHDAWWHEALRLYASKVDATAILQACIAANSTSTLTLAAEILEEGVHRVNGDLLYAVQEHLKNPLKSNIELVSKLLGEPLSGLQANKDILPAFTPFTVNQPPKPDPYRLAGTILAGKYLLQEHAGNGGMGVVYRATLLNSTTQVAVKILKPDLVLNHPDYVELFRREAKAARSLNHPNIVKVIDHGADSENAFIVMEWLDGLTLEEVLDRDRLDMGQIIEIFRQVCSAFEVAHLNNIIHLDVKPANIFVLSHEQPLSQIKVIDFGLAKVISNDSGTTVTRFFGTYKYCSPEHFGGKVSHRSDIYSLAVTLYHMLAGALPIGNSYINAKAHGNLDLPPIPSLRRIRPELPSAIDEMIAKALSRDPRNRPASARQLFEDFLNALGTK